MGLIIGDGHDELRSKLADVTVIVPQWHVGNDHWLDNVLEELWPKFVALRTEFSVAASKSIDDARASQEKWLAQLTALNPESSMAEIEEEAKRRSGMNKSQEDRVAHRFWGRAMCLYTEVAILSAALCEAEINLALAWGLSMVDKEDLFQLLESNSTVDKWLHGPKILIEGYEFPAGCAEAETLRTVFSERNRLVHPKSTVRKEGQEKLRGKSLKLTNLSDVLKWIERFFSLPFDLADFLRSQPSVNCHSFPVMSRGTGIQRARQHKLNRVTTNPTKSTSK